MSEAQTRLDAALQRIPYAGFLGVRAELKGDELTLVLPFAAPLIGNPLLPALHGGVVGALMELTALMQLAVASNNAAYAKTIDVNVDYLRSGKPADTYARARLNRVGRRIANVQVEAWQGERAEPIAAMRAHFLLPEEPSEA
jgi:uncharacterized protein (TIGR00369 family)